MNNTRSFKETQYPYAKINKKISLTRQNRCAYNAAMKKQDLITYLGGTAMTAAIRLGYNSTRPDNNIIRLPEVLTKRQADAIIMRMKAKRIKVPPEWLK